MTDLTTRFYCGCCDVSFVDIYPAFADVTPCLGCDCEAVAVTELERDEAFTVDEIDALYPTN